VQDAAAFLHAAVVPAPYDLIAVHDYGADRDAAFRESLFGFFDRGLEKWVIRIHTGKTLPLIGKLPESPKLPKLPMGFRPTHNPANIGDFGNVGNFLIRSSAVGFIELKNEILCKEKGLDRLSSRPKTTGERLKSTGNLRAEVEFDDYS
jgi:hypothetical protein